MTKSTCYAPECTRPTRATGLCGGHYQQKSAGKPLTPLRERPTATECTLDFCDRKHYSKNLCAAHYQQKLAGKPFTDVRVIDPNRTCDVDGCEDKPEGKGYCRLHYRRARKNGAPDKGKYGALNLCSAEGCQRASRTRGMCDMHFKREWRGEMRHEVTCEHCGETKPTKLPNLTYCSPSCAAKGNYQRTKHTRKIHMSPLSAAYRAGDRALVLALIKERTSTNENGCWVWTGRLTDAGYATAGVAGKSRAVHRVSLEARLGCPLGRIQAHHTCATPACVNPDHLQPAHQRDNIAEMQIRGSLVARIDQLEDELRRLDPTSPLLAMSGEAA